MYIAVTRSKSHALSVVTNTIVSLANIYKGSKGIRYANLHTEVGTHYVNLFKTQEGLIVDPYLYTSFYEAYKIARTQPNYFRTFSITI